MLGPRNDVTSYKEVTSPPLSWRLLGASEIALGLAFLIVTGILRHELEAVVIAPLVASLILLLVGFVTATSAILVEVEGDHLRLAYGGVWCKELTFSELSQLRAVIRRSSSFGGLGLRVVGHNRAVLFSSGPGVEFSGEGTSITYFIRTDHPMELLAAVSSRHDSAPAHGD